MTSDSSVRNPPRPGARLFEPAGGVLASFQPALARAICRRRGALELCNRIDCAGAGDLGLSPRGTLATGADHVGPDARDSAGVRYRASESPGNHAWAKPH